MAIECGAAGWCGKMGLARVVGECHERCGEGGA